MFTNKTESGSKRESIWHTLELSVNEITDKLNKGIDVGIKPIVIACKAHGLGTVGSCEGHLDRGLPYPWIDIASVFAEKLLSDKRYTELKQKMRTRKDLLNDEETKELKN